ncbi:MAG: cellulase family glycosylhydrolase, partial [Ardenticatenales bacterium]|nr:cellulase family glycosylhydrolase [Ardenticatenales bacterium]
PSPMRLPSSRLLLLPLLLLLLILLFLPILAPPLRDLMGEEARAAQIRGLGHLLSGRLRPYPAADALRPVRHAGLYPFGINTFLQTESEPDKVERSLDMIAAGGFRWIRQEFTWEDLEIHHDNWFVDLRNNEIRNAWTKYDRIVELAEERNIELIVRLSNPPEWSRAAGDAQGSKAPPDSLEQYGDYVEAIVSRYRGRVRYYQLWNEPNCCEEWGQRPVSPEQYVELLKVAYTRAKAADPDVVILTAPLAPTIELDYYPSGFNDFLFLQRMYDAGARDYFDILAVQDYGLFSGPRDRRMRPRVINYSRPLYLRDIMIRNGDAEKAIWASEIGWNSTPPGSGIIPSFGVTTEEMRGPYLVEALERHQREWPWMGVTTVWFFKQANEEEKNQAQYYFKLVNPDFTPQPAWESLTSYITTLQPTLYRGYHQEDHWVLREGLSNEEAWQVTPHESAVLSQFAIGQVGETLRFGVEGQRLTLVLQPGRVGTLLVRVGGASHRFQLNGENALDTSGKPLDTRDHLNTGVTQTVFHLSLGPLPPGRTEIELVVEQGEVALDGVIVE